MPNGYAILAGLTEVDSRAPFYREVMGGFDGRSGCEGVSMDLERMERLLHHLGFQFIGGAPLINQEATAAGLHAALRHAANQVQAQDLFVLYLSCHGLTRRLGRSEFSPAMIENVAINQFLLHDRPFYNFEILSRLAAFPSGSLALTIIDACHAGIGSGLIAHEERAAQESLERAQQGRDAALFNVLSAGIFQAQKALGMGTADLLSTLLVGPGKKDPLRQKLLLQPGLEKILLFEGYTGAPADLKLRCQLGHWGAARSRSVALGGEMGSLFTRHLARLARVADPAAGYGAFFQSLRNQLPARYAPYEEFYPYAGSQDLRRPSANHFFHTGHLLRP